MKDYELGEVPSIGVAVELLDQRNNRINTVGYSSVELEMRGTDDETLDLTGVTVTAVPSALGTYVIDWPKNRSIFEKTGRYLLRFVLKKADGSKEYTRPEEIRVRDFGRLYK